MNLTHLDQIAKAVLYEGYMLYPYRPSSVKNRQRWNFGVVYPPSYQLEGAEILQHEDAVSGLRRREHANGGKIAIPPSSNSRFRTR